MAVRITAFLALKDSPGDGIKDFQELKDNMAARITAFLVLKDSPGDGIKDFLALKDSLVVRVADMDNRVCMRQLAAIVTALAMLVAIPRDTARMVAVEVLAPNSALRPVLNLVALVNILRGLVDITTRRRRNPTTNRLYSRMFYPMN